MKIDPFRRSKPARSPGLLPLLALIALACGDPVGKEGRQRPDEIASVDEPAPPTLPEPDPHGVTFYRWEDVYAAGRLDWAWAIAVDHGNVEQVERLLADGVDPDVLIGGNYQASSAPRQHGRTALMNAGRLGYEELARRLLAAGADPLVREIAEEDYFSGDTALHRAAASGHEKPRICAAEARRAEGCESPALAASGNAVSAIPEKPDSTRALGPSGRRFSGGSPDSSEMF